MVLIVSMFIFSAKRAAYRWARDRAKIASRWTWLLAQISDLEYRVRQHQELYILLKKSNGTHFERKKKNKQTFYNGTNEHFIRQVK